MTLLLDLSTEEVYDEVNNLFLPIKPNEFRVCHSLYSMAKWEAHWEIPFFPSGAYPIKKTVEQSKNYIACMIIGQQPTQDALNLIWNNHSGIIDAYMEKKQTATVINRIENSAPSREFITSEIVYYWMIEFGIPFECDKWHINRLLTLIDVCNIKRDTAAGKNKLNTRDALIYRKQLNEHRLAMDKLNE